MHVRLVDIPALLLPRLREVLSRYHQVSIATGDLLDPDLDHAGGCEVVVHGLPSPSSSAEAILLASLGTWNLTNSLAASSVTTPHYVLLSSMSQFSGYDQLWDVDQRWAPRPDSEELSSHCAELLSREQARRLGLSALALRLGTVVDDEEFSIETPESDVVHLDDAIAAIVAAVDSTPVHQWQPVHIVSGNSVHRPGGAVEVLGWTPAHVHPDPETHRTAAQRRPTWPTVPQPISGLTPANQITVYGAGGPLGAMAVEHLQDGHTLLITDAEAIEVTSQRPPQSPGAPLPQRANPPHQHSVLDITDADAVRRAAVGADCLMNLAVVRHDPVATFTVNVLGALNVMRAALAEGVPRVVHTGPTLAFGEFPHGHLDDRRVPSTAPYRPGSWIYLNAKMVAQEIVRIFAEQHQLAPLPCSLLSSSTPGRTNQLAPFRCPGTTLAGRWLRPVR